MSLEQTFSQKLNLEPEVSSSSTSTQSDHQTTHHQNLTSASAGAGSSSGKDAGGSSGVQVTFKPTNETSTSSSSNSYSHNQPPQSSPSAAHLNSTGETHKGRTSSPINSLSPGSPKSSNRHHFSSSATSGSRGGGAGGSVQFAGVGPDGKTAEGGSGTPPERAHSVKLTRKIFNNWRSACGKTKDRTRDFMRRWKTLPENHPDFDQIDAQPNSSSRSKAGRPSIAFMSSLHQQQPHYGADGVGGKLKQLTKKHSEIEMQRGASIDHHDDPGGGAGIASSATVPNKSSAGWSVHIWATWVQRGSCEDDIENEVQQQGREFLSEFQKVKLTHFFRHVLDMNHDDVISAEDFVALNQRIRHYIEWSSECIEFHILKEVHSGFLECFLNQPLDDCSHMYYCSSERETRHHVNIDEWLDVWGTLLQPSRSLLDLPLWLQYFPKILFQVINKSGSGTISKEELRAFYTMFLGIDFRLVNETLDVIYNAMTDEGQYKINYGLFKLCFTNFLLAKYPHGPGQYLFGICSPQTLVCSFPIDYSALNTPQSDLEPYDPEKDKSQSNRRSVIV